MTTTKDITIINNSLFSGSSDTFRTAVGGFWTDEETEYGILSAHTLYPLENLENTYINGMEENIELKQTITPKDILPNFTFPVRILGNKNLIENDKHWKTILLGGTFADTEYKAIYNKDIWSDDYFVFSKPYSQKEGHALSDNFITNTIEISYKYNGYLPAYERHIDTLESETLIPSMYFIEFLRNVPNTASAVINTHIKNFISLEDSIDPFVLLEPNKPRSENRRDNRRQESSKIEEVSSTNLDNYLSSSYVKTPLSGSTITAIKKISQNIMFDEDSIEQEALLEKIEFDQIKFPYYNTISFSSSAGGTFTDSISRHQYSQRFLKILKEAFEEENTELEIVTTPYSISEEYYSGSIIDETVSTIDTVNSLNLRSVNFVNLLLDSYNNIGINTSANFYFIGEETAHRRATTDTKGAYRYRDTVATLGVIEDMFDYLNNEDNFNIDSISDLYNFDAKTMETLAYRVEKKAVAITEGPQTQQTIQNFWFFNAPSLVDFRYYDSQVKYGKEYTYKVYAYVLTTGVKYRFDNLRLTRQIGTIEAGDTQQYCLDFYDPVTNDSVGQLLEETSNLADTNEFITNSTISHDSPYLADFDFFYKPHMQVLEMPLYEKTLTVLDNPPNMIYISPFQVLDNSQRIGFYLQLQSFSNLPFPTPILPADEDYKTSYLNGKDLFTSENLNLETVSRSRYIEVYRIDKKPTKMADFDQNLLKRIDLKFEDSSYIRSDVSFYDQIATNKKYYYLFRAMNEHRNYGQLSYIYQTELVDDGGYKYALFDLIYEEDINKEKEFVNPLVPFKKIFQLRPNISQLIFNDENVNYEADAATQIDNLQIGTANDLIWGKTFKLRMTSKKTGKKIDLNITYNLDSE